MDLKELSIVAIKTMLASEDTVPEELLEALMSDSRSQVKSLGERVLKKKEQELARQEEQEKMLELERTFHARNLRRVAGVDEAGRGPLAGPVVAAAVIFRPEGDYPLARDSKALSAEKREELFEQIHVSALAVGLGMADHEEIDKYNIYNASLLAMTRAVENLGIKPDAVITDGTMVLRLKEEIPQEAVVKGDQKCLSIAAASIVAKVTRDKLMVEYDQEYPGYGLARHKGYPTADHLKAIKVLGPCPIHRKSFGAVAECGDFSSREWKEFYGRLTKAYCLEELQRVGELVKPLRDKLSTAELNSLRSLYLRKKESLAGTENNQ